jgi:polyphosphate kinase
MPEYFKKQQTNQYLLDRLRFLGIFSNNLDEFLGYCSNKKIKSQGKSGAKFLAVFQHSN